MSFTGLESRFVFGCSASTVRNSTYFCQDNKSVIFPAGHGVAVHDVSKRGRVLRLPGSVDSLGIRTLARTVDQKFVAVGERGVENGIVRVFDISKVSEKDMLAKTIHLKSNPDVLSVAFSGDGSRLLVMSGAPKWTLTCYDWLEGKVVAYLEGIYSEHNDPDDARFRGEIDCMFSPVDKTLCSVVGGDIVKNFRIIEEEIREIPLTGLGFSYKVFGSALCSSWLPNRPEVQIVGTASGKIVAIESGNVRGELLSSPRSDVRIICITPTASGGFICGCNDARVLEFDTLWKVKNEDFDERESAGTEDKSKSNREEGRAIEDDVDVLEAFALRSTHRIDQESDNKSNVVGVAAESVCGRRYVCSLTSNQVFVIRERGEEDDDDDDEDEVTKDADSKISAAHKDGSKGKDVIIEPLICEFHRPVLENGASDGHGRRRMVSRRASSRRYDAGGGSDDDVEARTNAAITGMDVCRRRPVVVTCGADSSVRIWNYMEGTCELAQSFNERTLSIAIHPSGHQLLIGFEDKLRLMGVLFDRLTPLKEFPVKHCVECRFSVGGQFFACAHNNSIQIYRTYTCTLVQKLTGHTGKVQSIFWTDFDSKILSAGLGGSVYVWDVHAGKRVEEFVKKGIKFTSAVCDAYASHDVDSKMIFAVGDDKHLKRLDIPDVSVAGDIAAGTMLSRLALSSRTRYPMLFAGTAPVSSTTNGSKSGGPKFPFKPSVVRAFRTLDLSDAGHFPATNGSVTKLCISHDNSHLFVAGEDGTLLIFRVLRDGGGSDRDTKFSGDVLVAKPDLVAKRTLLEELKMKVTELDSHYKYQFKMKEDAYNDTVKQLEENFREEAESKDREYADLMDRKDDREKTQREEILKLEDIQLHELQRIEAEYQTMIMTEVEAIQEKKQELLELKAKLEKEQQQLLESQEKQIQQITLEMQRKFERERNLRRKAEDDLETANKCAEEEKSQLCEDIDTEIEDMKQRYDTMLDSERIATLRYKGENGIMRKKFSALGKDIESQREDIKAMLDKEKKLHLRIVALKEEIHGYEDLIRERDATVSQKEKTIHTLKKKNQELEKFKFVLDFKVKELKRQIEPRKNEISNMKKRIAEMDKELERYHKNNASLDKEIGNLRRQFDEKQNQVYAHRQKIRATDAFVENFISALYDTVQKIQDPDKLRASALHLYETYSGRKERKGDKSTVPSSLQDDDSARREFERQRQFMKRTIRNLKRRVETQLSAHERENRKQISENMGLIKEITELRKMTRALHLETEAKKGAKASRRRSRTKRNMKEGVASPTTVATIEKQRARILELKTSIREIEERVRLSRPISRGEALPPLERESSSAEGAVLPPME